MSIRSATDLAIRRDETPIGVTVKSNDDSRYAERAADVLITAIPTEVLALYTAVTGGSLALLIDQESTGYLPYRWGLLAFVVVLTPLAVAATYRRKSRMAAESARTHRQSRTPWAEMTASTIAAAGFFLAMPGSPLLAQIEGPASLLTAVAISLCAPALLDVVFGDLLRTGTLETAGNRPVSPAVGLATSTPLGKP